MLKTRQLSEVLAESDLKRKRKQLLSELRGVLDVHSVLYDLLGIQNAREVETRNGTQIVHSCPLPWGLHKNGDATPSAAFHPASLQWNCWGCGGGDIFWLVANVLEIDTQQAVDLLMGRLVTRDKTPQEFLAELESLWEDSSQVAFSMPSYSEKLIVPWRRITEYMTSRLVSPETQVAMQTGLDLKNRELYERGSVKEWFTQPRVTIPLFYNGKLRGWQKRHLAADQYGPKYKFSPSFPRSYVLYGLQEVSGDEVIVVESPMSVLRMRSLGISHVVATYGSEVTEEQLLSLRRFDKVYSFMDADAAGARANETVVEGLERYTKVWVVPIECENTDPADYDRRALDGLLAWSEPSSLWRRN